MSTHDRTAQTAASWTAAGTRVALARDERIWLRGVGCSTTKQTGTVTSRRRGGKGSSGEEQEREGVDFWDRGERSGGEGG